MANSTDETTLSPEIQEAYHGSCSDKISALPDALIRRILSFLSTKQAMTTSVLSKRWVRLWTLVPTLDFEDSCHCRIDEQAKMKFVDFVNRVLMLADSIEKFRLKCSSIYGHSRINTWICSAIERGLEEVDISVSENGEGGLVMLPSALFLVKTLKFLKLHGGIVVDVPDTICLPSLKILHVLGVNYGNVESVRWLVSGCTSLEELRIDANINQENMVNINISAPALNSLSLTLELDGHLEPHEGKVEINTPSLKHLYFSSSNYISEPYPYSVENFPCLIEANISVLDCYEILLFRALDAVKCLKLHGFLAEPARTSFPMFVNLTRLELHGPVSWFVVSLFLRNSHKLETLLVETKILVGNVMKWRQPELIPLCFFSSLTTACFVDFEGLESEMKMVEYFLKNARVLQTMEIHTSDFSSDSKLCILKQLSTFRRGSETCQLSFN